MRKYNVSLSWCREKEQFKHKLLELGLLTEIKNPLSKVPIGEQPLAQIQGKPLSQHVTRIMNKIILLLIISLIPLGCEETVEVQNQVNAFIIDMNPDLYQTMSKMKQ
ncbi:MAG: hypothetical protein ABFS56_00940 [Pseudomonadota bacterium]